MNKIGEITEAEGFNSTQKLEKIKQILFNKTENKTNIKTETNSMTNNIHSEVADRRNDFVDAKHKNNTTGSKSMGFAKAVKEVRQKQEETPVASRAFEKYTIRNSFGGVANPNKVQQVTPVPAQSHAGKSPNVNIFLNQNVQPNILDETCLLGSPNSKKKEENVQGTNILSEIDRSGHVERPRAEEETQETGYPSYSSSDTLRSSQYDIE